MASQDDILFEAGIDDGTIEFFERFDANLTRIANAAESNFDTIDKRIDKSATKAGLLAGAMTSVATAVINMGMQAVAGLKGFIGESIQLAARLDVLETVLFQVGTQSGYAREQLKEYEEQVKAEGITTEKAREGLLLLMTANIDLANARKLAVIAQNAAVRANMNSSEAFERLAVGIQKREPELLDELGLTLDREKAYTKLARTLGKTKDQLTEAQQQQAIINDIFRQAEPILGVYDAAMGDAGKQAGSLARHIDNIKEAIGAAFQPAYSAQIEFMTEELIKLKEWFEDNEETVAEFGDAVTALVKNLTVLLSDVIKFALELPGKLEKATMAIAEFTNTHIAGMDEVEAKEKSTIENLGLTARKLLTLLVTASVTTISSILNAVGFLGSAFKLLKGHILGDIGDEEFATRLVDRWKRAVDNIQRNTTDAFNDMGEKLQLFGDTVEELPEELPEYDTTTQVDNLEGLEEAIDEVNAAFQELRDEMEEEAELRGIKETRKRIERELRDSWKREDIERNTADRIEEVQISADDRSLKNFEKWQKNRQKAALKHADRLIDIEKYYRRRLRDIEKDFEFEANELARKRDAVGLLELERRTNREIDRAKEARDDQKADAEESYTEQLQALEEAYKEFEDTITESIKEQLDDIEEGRKKEYEALARSLERQKIIRELHAGWEAEDREVELQKKLEELGENFAGIEGLTAEGLQNVLGEWEFFFGDLAGLYQNFLNQQEAMNAQMVANVPGPGLLLTPGVGYHPSAAAGYTPQGSGYIGDAWQRSGYWGRGGAGESTGSENFGQAGQVSTLLADILANSRPLMTVPNQTPPRLPGASPQGTVQRKEIHVTADLSGIDPHLQQMLINTITEIERNRGD